jgi:hypothetical protein
MIQSPQQSNGRGWLFFSAAVAIVIFAFGAWLTVSAIASIRAKSKPHPIESLHTFIPRYRITTNGTTYGLETQVPLHEDGGFNWHPVDWTTTNHLSAVHEIASRTRLVVELWPMTYQVFEAERSK